MFKVAFIEDNAEYARLLQEALRMQPEILCLFVAPSVEAFWTMLPKRATIDMLFVDIELPGKSGIDALPGIRQRLPNAEIVMLTHVENEDLLLRALHNGASSYLNKDFSIFQLPQFIQILRQGGALISPKMARKLVRFFNPPPEQNVKFSLTSKELQILQLFSEGLSYEEAANATGITVDGIRYHVRNIYRKLNVDNKVAALRIFKELKNDY